jgi:hypothetical protein
LLHQTVIGQSAYETFLAGKLEDFEYEPLRKAGVVAA